ncbi:hypothetical protein SMSP2_01962 [Limihaloglobus sulfuriphilus]|uniref:LamG-like jellyroll fold domain-containing protein n=1 Tax=Limihaloglobus sulfuriphilus TaxID=1851148 RepID=A0A1Q2MFV4_9BACT|nr:LamG domain-containing protein [Limihaloglobus sulfuriphilus]AQQ71586.1 hypothetical protein SMSP2_01962 [Limihaloglobus sulfuriphilus]
MKTKTLFWILALPALFAGIAGANLLQNPGFEEGSGTSQAENWLFAGGNVVRVAETQEGHGEWQLQIQDLEALNWAWAEQTVDLGQNAGGFEFTAYVEFKARMAGEEAAYLNIEFYDADDTLLSGQDAAELKPTDPDYIELSWVSRSITLTAPANTQKVRFRVVGYMGGGTHGDWGVIRADNVSLTSPQISSPALVVPTPADGSRIAAVEGPGILTWSSSSNASSYNLYLGEYYDEVNEASDPNVLPGRGNLTEAYYLTEQLVEGRTYYWRVDDLDADDQVVNTGKVWSFTVVENMLNNYGFEFEGPSPEAPAAWWTFDMFRYEGNSLGGDYSLKSEFANHDMWTLAQGWRTFGQDQEGLTYTASVCVMTPDGLESGEIADVHIVFMDKTEQIVGSKTANILSGDSVPNKWYYGSVSAVAPANTYRIDTKLSHTFHDYYYNGTVHFDNVGLVYKGSTYSENFYPADGLSVPMNTDSEVRLEWDPGANTDSYNVYFGDDYQSVADAADPDTLPGRGSQTLTTYTAQSLELGRTYYWRVDDVIGSEIRTGEVLSFTADSIAVDTFREYVDSDLLRDKWSCFYNDTTNFIALSETEGTDSKAMRINYNNFTTTMPLSMYKVEATRQFDTAADMTMGGQASLLTIVFRGSADNQEDPIYVRLEDSSAQTSQIDHPDYQAVQNADYTAWEIPLADFGTGIDLAAVSSITVGVGDGVENPSSSGSDAVYIDHITLSPSTCRPELSGLGADINGDCAVDLEDLVIVLDGWLTQPALASYQFDTGSGTVAVDSAGSGYDGDITGCTWVSGKYGSALSFDAAAGDRVHVAHDVLSAITDQITVALWQYGDPTVQPAADYCFDASRGLVNSEQASILRIHIPHEDGSVYFDAGGSHVDGFDRIGKAAAPEEYEGQWNHWAFTKNVTDGTMKIYLNGRLWHSGSGMTLPLSGNTEFAIGSRLDGDGGEYYEYDGQIDDFRIFDKELTEQEIQQLMGGSLNPAAGNINDDAQVDYADFAEIAAEWLHESLWP